MPAVLTFFVSLIAIALSVLFITHLTFELGAVIWMAINVSKKKKEELVKEDPRNHTVKSKSFIYGLLAAFFWALIIAF